MTTSRIPGRSFTRHLQEDPITARALELIGDPHQALIDQKRFIADHQYLNSQLDGWRDDYPDRWIAVFELALVATADSPEGIREALLSKSVPLNRSVVTFLHRDPATYLHTHPAG